MPKATPGSKVISEARPGAAQFPGQTTGSILNVLRSYRKVAMVGLSANPNRPSYFAATYLKAAAKRGAELIVIDPRGQSQGLARYASHVLEFKVGQDVALLNAMPQKMIEAVEVA